MKCCVMQHSIWVFSDSTVSVLTNGLSINLIAFYLCYQFRCVNILNIHVYMHIHTFYLPLYVF